MNANIAELILNDAPLYAVADALQEIGENYNYKLHNKDKASDFLFKNKSKYLNSLSIKNFTKKCNLYVGSKQQNKYICLKLKDIVKISIWYYLTQDNQNFFINLINRKHKEPQSVYKQRMAELINILTFFKLHELVKKAQSAQWQAKYAD